MKYHYLSGKTDIVIFEVKRLKRLDKNVCIVCCESQENKIKEKCPDFINKIIFKRNNKCS